MNASLHISPEACALTNSKLSLVFQLWIISKIFSSQICIQYLNFYVLRGCACHDQSWNIWSFKVCAHKKHVIHALKQNLILLSAKKYLTSNKSYKRFIKYLFRRIQIKPTSQKINSGRGSCWKNMQK